MDPDRDNFLAPAFSIAFLQARLAFELSPRHPATSGSVALFSHFIPPPYVNAPRTPRAPRAWSFKYSKHKPPLLERRLVAFLLSLLNSASAAGSVGRW